MGGDPPAVAEGVGDRRRAVPVELVVWRAQDSGTRRLGPGNDFVDDDDDGVQRHGRRPGRGRSDRTELGDANAHHDERIAGQQLGVQDTAVRGPQPSTALHRIEYVHLDRDRRICVRHKQAGADL